MSTTERSRAPLSRNAILDEAREMMSSDGPTAVSLRRLAGRLGVTAPALYSHFDSKDALLAAIAADEFALLIERVESVADGVADPIERIRLQARAYVDHALDNPALFQVMTVFRPAWSPQQAAPELPMASKSFEVASAAVTEAVDAGLLRETDPLMASLTVWAAAHGVATILLARPQLGDDYESALADSVIDSVVEGLLAR